MGLDLFSSLFGKYKPNLETDFHTWQEFLTGLIHEHNFNELEDYFTAPYGMFDAEWQFMNEYIFDHILGITNEKYHRLIGNCKSVKECIILLARETNNPEKLVYINLQTILNLKIDSKNFKRSIHLFKDCKTTFRLLNVHFSPEVYKNFLINSLSAEFKEIKDNFSKTNQTIELLISSIIKTGEELIGSDNSSNESSIDISNYRIAFENKNSFLMYKKQKKDAKLISPYQLVEKFGIANCMLSRTMVVNKLKNIASNVKIEKLIYFTFGLFVAFILMKCLFAPKIFKEPEVNRSIPYSCVSYLGSFYSKLPNYLRIESSINYFYSKIPYCCSIKNYFSSYLN